MLEQLVKNQSPWDRLMVEKFMDNCFPWEATHAGVREGLLSLSNGWNNLWWTDCVSLCYWWGSTGPGKEGVLEKGVLKVCFTYHSLLWIWWTINSISFPKSSLFCPYSNLWSLLVLISTRECFVAFSLSCPLAEQIEWLWHPARVKPSQLMNTEGCVYFMRGKYI